MNVKVDVKAQESINHQLKQSMESLEFALQSAGMGTWDLDLASDTVQCSKDMLKLWEIDPEAFNGKRSILQSKVHPHDVENMRKAIDIAIQNRSIYELEYRLLLSNGSQRWIKSRGRCTYSLNSDEPVRLSGVVFDVTDTKTKAIAVEAALKEREQFLTIASHELRTPLTCLQLQLQVLEWELKNKFHDVYESERINQGFHKQKEHLARLSRIIDNIFEHSKIADGDFNLKPTTFNLVPMVKDVVDRFNVLLRSNAHNEITITRLNEKIQGRWDHFRLEQVLTNLLANALRFGNKKPIKVEVGENAGKALIKVRDEGSGIRQEDQTRIFERFGRSSIDNEMSGIGLGLFLSKSIVQSHGGEIQLKSEPGLGSEFTVILPL